MHSAKLLVIKPNYTAWPVGFAYVLKCLEDNNISFDFIDASRSISFSKEIKSKLRNNEYAAVASGGLLGHSEFFKEIVLVLRKINKNTPFILGGNIIKDGFDELLFDYIGIDYGVLGESETSLPQLVDFIYNNKKLISDIPGAVYKDRNNVIVRKSPERFDLVSKNIFPAWDNFDVEFYVNNCSVPFVGPDMRFMPVLTGRGCVGKCTFCSPSIGGFRKRPISHVIDEIKYLTLRYDFKRIFFYNEMFYASAKDINNFCEEYYAIENKKPWMAAVRVDANIGIDTFTNMKKAGCELVSAGIESGSDEILALMRKHTKAEKILAFFMAAKVAHLPSNGTFIIGNEGETEEDIIKTIDLAIKGEINTGESLMYLYPGTAIYDHAKKKGLIVDDMKYFKQMLRSGTGSLYSGLDQMRKNFINMTNLSISEFYKVAIREIRRYNTFVFNRYSVKDLSCRIDVSQFGVKMVMSGSCCECGTPVCYEYYIYKTSEYLGVMGDGINDRLICQKCYHQLSFNYLEEKENALYYKGLKNKIKNYRRIVISGINDDALNLMRINYFDIDYNDVLGFVDFNKLTKNSHFADLPIINKDDIARLTPDCVLVLDADMSYAGICIKKIFKSKKVPAPDVLYLKSDKIQLEINLNYKAYKANRNTIEFIKEKCGIFCRYGKDKFLALNIILENNNIQMLSSLIDTLKRIKTN